MKKKILAGILTVCMVVTMTPAMAFASSGSAERAPAAPANQAQPDTLIVEKTTAKKAPASQGDVAELNGKTFPTLEFAIGMANSGDTVKLLSDVNESVEIKKGITLDLNDYTLYADDNRDTIVVDNTRDSYEVTIMNGTVVNGMGDPSSNRSAVYVVNGNVTLSRVNATMAGTGSSDYQGAVVYVEGDTTTFVDSYIFYEDSLVTAKDQIDGLYVDISGTALLKDSNIVTWGGDCAYIDGTAEFTGCYLAADGEYSSAVYLGKNAKSVNIYSGYYYGDTPLYSDTAKAVCKIYEGEFSSAYEDVPVIDGDVSGYANAFVKASVSGKNIISTPLNNWKTADNALIFNGVAAPATVKANLTAVNGQQAGYDDIKVTWTAAKGSTADGYRVNYKKGTSAYVNGKFYKGAGSRTVANLDDGYKYTFQVTPYVIINEEIFGTGTKCFSNKTKTAYTYTLKKVALNNFSKSGTKVKVAWKNINGETGYQISKATSKTGTNIVATVATTTGTSKLINATKGKTYYYKVRAYKTVDGKKIFGPWSAVKSYKR